MKLRNRKGIALFVTMFFVGGIGALALSAIYLTANASLLSSTYEKEDDLKYISEAALQIGKAELNFNPAALPNTSYVALMTNKTLPTADGQTVPGLKVNLYVGPTGSTSGQFGRFAGVVAEARDANGTGFVRRLELTQESFAKYAYWTNSENNASGGTIVFGGGDALWGPVWSNDTITVNSTGASFHDNVGTAAPVIAGASYGTFYKGYQVKQPKINLPSLSALSSLSGLATVSGFNFTPPTTGDETTVRMRLEFVAADLDGNGDSTGVNEGFFRVYTATTGNSAWLRGDFPGAATAVTGVLNCGDWHAIGSPAVLKFFPAAVHPTSWFQTLMATAASSGGGGMTSSAATTEQNATLETILGHTNARCYLGGDPHLVAVSRTTALGYTNAQIQKGGEDTTFTPTDARGAWSRYSTSPNSLVATKRAAVGDAQYLYPLYRGFNTNTKGVIYAGGTIGVSGTVRGLITMYSPNTIVILDDLRYANDPAIGVCLDILGTISGANTVIADNGLNDPQDIHNGSGSVWKTLDDTPGIFVHDVIMALGESFAVENYDTGPTNASTCGTTTVGRGCLYLTGGLIQNRRGAVGLTSGQGYTKRYSYDRCAIVNPPPYFPTTGRFQDNRFYELDPVRINSSITNAIKNLYLSLTPDR